MNEKGTDSKSAILILFEALLTVSWGEKRNAERTEDPVVENADTPIPS